MSIIELQYTAINAKVNPRSEESVRQAEELMRSMEEPDAVTYQCRKYALLGLFVSYFAILTSCKMQLSKLILELD
jgi:hypothetical protein